MRALPEYPSFAALLKHHVEGRDFTRVIEVRDGARVAIIAPHGGKIEPRTDSIAKALAGKDLTFECGVLVLVRSRQRRLRYCARSRFRDTKALGLTVVLYKDFQHVGECASLMCCRYSQELLHPG